MELKGGIILNEIFDFINKQNEYKVLYINYQKENGIQWLNNFSKELLDDLFYKIYVFNDEFMITFYRLNNNIKYEIIKKEDIKEEKREKKIYLDINKNNKYKNLFYRVGVTNDNKEIIQFIRVE
jgi:hypothetical protein